LARTPGRAGLFLDFDGVLADIVPEPNGARMRPGMSDLLVALNERLGRVAVISGRPLDFIADMIPVTIDLVGLYGLESRTGGVIETRAEAEPFRATVAELVEAATERFGSAVVEPKGLSLTIHYRGDADLAGPMREWAVEHGERAGMEFRTAKRSYELHPPLTCDKGTVLVELAEGFDPVVYVGDDLGDVPAFDGLDRLAADGVGALRVAVASSETPPILLERADLTVDGPAGAEALLRRILVVAEPAVE
jgi:trehalose 6-phosphate phosphatase